MGRFATGVTVVTTTHKDTIHGMTANAFLSVSLRPPLVLVSLGRCRMSEMLPRTGRYGVSVLASDQEHFAAHFAGQRVSPRRRRSSSGSTTSRCSAGRWPTSAAGSSTSTPPATTSCGSARSSISATATASRCCSTPGRFGTLREVSDRSSSAERATGGRSARRSRRGCGRRARSPRPREPQDRLAERIPEGEPNPTPSASQNTAWASSWPDGAQRRHQLSPAIHTRQSARRRTRRAASHSHQRGVRVGSEHPGRLAFGDQLDQRRQRPPAGDPQQLGRHPGLRGPLRRSRGRHRGPPRAGASRARARASASSDVAAATACWPGSAWPLVSAALWIAIRSALGSTLTESVASMHRPGRERRDPRPAPARADPDRVRVQCRHAHDDRPALPVDERPRRSRSTCTNLCKVVDCICTNWYNRALRRRGSTHSRPVLRRAANRGGMRFGHCHR